MSDDDNTNGLEELTEFLESILPGFTPHSEDILAAEVNFGMPPEHATDPFILPVGYESQELPKFFDYLNREYYGGYGSQKLFGTIWLQDGSWLTRREYDGAEWWTHNSCPPLPRKR